MEEVNLVRKILFGKGLGTGHGPVKNMETLRDLVGFAALGPLSANICFKNEESSVVITETAVKKIEGGIPEDLKTTREQVLEFIRKVGNSRGLADTERFLQNRSSVPFVNGLILSTRNIKIRKL